MERRDSVWTTITSRRRATALKRAWPSSCGCRKASFVQIRWLSPTAAPVRPATARPILSSTHWANVAERGAAENANRRSPPTLLCRYIAAMGAVMPQARRRAAAQLEILRRK